MHLWQYCLLVTARSLYMFRMLPASIIRSTKNSSSSHWCLSWVGVIYIQQGRPRSVAHDMHQWLILQFLVLLMMDAESVRNMYSDLAFTNKQHCQSCILLVLYII